MNTNRDAADIISDIKYGLAALMAIQTAIAEGDPCPENGAGMLYVLNHLTEEANTLEKMLLKAAASSPQASRV